MRKQDWPPEWLNGDGNAVSTLRPSRKNEDDEEKEIAYLGIDDKRVPEDQRPCDDIEFTATCGRREPEQELRRKTISVRAHREKDDDKGADLLPSSFPHSTTTTARRTSNAHVPESP